eukprot:3337491-Prorocentrum_lima.AAC.1
MEATQKILEYDGYREELFTILDQRGEGDENLTFFDVTDPDLDFGYIPYESEIRECFRNLLSNVGRDAINSTPYHSSNVVYRRPPVPSQTQPAVQPPGTGVAGAYGPAREE